MSVYSVVQTKARLSEILREVEAGVAVTITRYGQPIATIRAVAKPSTAADWSRVAALRGKLPKSKLAAAKLVRQMRSAGF